MKKLFCLYCVSYWRGCVPLVKAVQEQQSMIEQLQQTNEKLKDAINKMEQRIEKLED